MLINARMSTIPTCTGVFDAIALSHPLHAIARALIFAYTFPDYYLACSSHYSSPPNLVRLYLIRHGETTHNRDAIMQGHGEAALSDLGIRQAARAGKRLADGGIDHIYSSDLRRAAMTAAIVAAFTEAPITYDHMLRERDPGDLTGQPYDRTVPFFTDRAYHPPNGESFAQFEDRVEKAFAALASREGDSDRHVAVVTHGMVCGAFLMVCLGYTFDERQTVSIPNASLTIADYNGAWKAVSILDTAHLDGLTPSGVHPTGA